MAKGFLAAFRIAFDMGVYRPILVSTHVVCEK